MLTENARVSPFWWYTACVIGGKKLAEILKAISKNVGPYQKYTQTIQTA